MAVAFQYYICNKCRFRTTVLSKIEDHLLVHDGAKPPSYFSCFDPIKCLKCIGCGVTTQSLVLLKYHLLRNHDYSKFAVKAKLKTCKKCRFCTYSNYLWIRHTHDTSTGRKNTLLKKRDGKWYLCMKCDYRTDIKHNKKCPKKFKTLSNLKNHLKYVHMSAVDFLHCRECDYSTPSKYSLRSHFNNKHAPPEETKWVECHGCGRKFKNKRALRLHFSRHTIREILLKCEHCNTKDKESLTNHVLVKHSIDGEVYQCKKCDQHNLSRLKLTNHMRVHEQSNVKITCEKCSFVTTNKQQLQRHIFNKHTDHTEEEKWNCPHCTYFNFNKRCLTRHLKLKHKIDGEVRWYECDRCNYINQDKRSLAKHMSKIHNKIDGEVRWYKCDKCNYINQDKRSLAKHMSKIHNENQEKHGIEQWIPIFILKK